MLNFIRNIEQPVEMGGHIPVGRELRIQQVGATASSTLESDVN